MFEVSFQIGLIIVLLAFIAEFVDSTLGMGYGTSLTPILLLMGFEPMIVVPAILVSELITGLLAGFTHHRMGNVDLKPKTMNIKRIIQSFKEMGVLRSVQRGLPIPLQVALLLAICSIIGTVAAVFIAVTIPKFYLKLYIGVMIVVIGLIVFITKNRTFSFSWSRITILGIIASFNKGMSGGGYGPVVTSGQIVSGVDSKNAVAITSVSEGLTCLVGVIMYITTGKSVDWSLAPYLVVGAILSVYPSAFFVNKINANAFKLSIGAITIILGAWTLLNI